MLPHHMPARHSEESRPAVSQEWKSDVLHQDRADRGYVCGHVAHKGCMHLYAEVCTRVYVIHHLLTWAMPTTVSG